MKTENQIINTQNAQKEVVSPLVSIVIATTDMQMLNNHIGSIMSQTYTNMEILIVYPQFKWKEIDVNNITKKYNKLNYKVKIIGFKQKNGSFRGPISDNELFLCGAEQASGDYLVFTKDSIGYSNTYIADMVATIKSEQADLAYSDFAIEWKNNIINRYVLKLDLSNNKTYLQTFVKYGGKLFGLSLTENKLISHKLWLKVVKELSEYYTDENSHIYMGELVFAISLWSKASKVTYVHEGVSIINWANDDEKLQACCGNWKLNMFIEEIKVSINYAKRICINNKIDINDINCYISYFLSRLVWRLDWFKSNIKTSIEKSFNILLAKFSMEFFEGRVYELDRETITLPSNRLDDALIDKNIKIFISMHKPSFVPDDNKYLIPIQVGTALADERFYGILHDDEGDNISKKNKMYCELTAQYWAWKNSPGADYYGFWHYRRYMTFNKDESQWDITYHEVLNNDSVKKSLIDEQHIAEICDQYDIIVPIEWNCKEDEKQMTVYEHWCKHFNKEDIDITVKVILDRYPQYYSAVMDVLSSTKAIFCNMFIMNSKMFNEYSEFCFNVLGEVETLLNQKRYNTEEYRTLGHIGERLLAFYVRYIELTRSEVNICHLGRVQYKDTRPVAKIIHPNKENCVSVMLACDDKYMKYTDVLLQSICENISNKYFYDIVICHRDICEYNQKIAKDIFSSKENVSIRFADVTRNFEKYGDVHVDRHLTYETYYRFLVLEIFKGYDRVLYLDCDMIVNTDIAELYFTEMQDEYISAVRDYDFIAACAIQKDEYFENILQHININDYFDYFQAGVILFNLSTLKTKFTSEKLFKVALSRDWWFHDQDVLNCLFNGHIKYINDKWNVFSLLEHGSRRETLITKILPAEFAESYHKSLNNPCIIHYAGVPKVWNDTEVDLGYIFWKYARKSPYYEKLLQTLIVGEGVKSDWIVTISDDCENKGIKFFTIKTIKENWSSNYCILDFTFLSNHQTIVSDTLTIAASMFPHETKGSWLDIKQFNWERNETTISDNVLFYINEYNDIEIYVRFIGQYTGFSFSVRSLESRNLTKPVIEINNHHFIDNLMILSEKLERV